MNNSVLDAETQQHHKTRPLSLRRNFSWTLFGGARVPGQAGNGVIDFRPGMRVLDALAAGGLVSPPEQTLATLVTDGGQQTRPIDLVALLSGKDIAQNAALAPGDTLLLQQRDPSTYTIQVLGDVAKPGAFTVTPVGASVVSQLTLAGGATTTAALTGAQVLHNGHATALNLHPLVSDLNDPSGAITLTAGDTLLIPDNQAKYAMLGEVRAPALYLIPDGQGMTVSTALAQAGGTTSDGDKKQVEILRRGADSKRDVIFVDMDKIADDDTDSADIALQPGDILVVPTRHKGHSIVDGAGAVSGMAYALRVLGL